MHSPFSIDELISSTELGTDAVTATLFHRDRIYLGTDKGSLLVFELAHASTSRAPPSAKLALKQPAFAKRPIEQLVALDEIDAIACLAGGDLSIHSMSSFALRSSFNQLTRATCSSIARTTSSTSVSTTKQNTDHTVLALACRRRLILLSWTGSGANAVGSNKEIALPHQVRGMSFTEDEGEAGTSLKLVLGFSTGEYGITTVPKLKHSAESGSESTERTKIRKPPPGSAAAPSSASGKLDQPLLGELFTPTLAGAVTKDVAPTLATVVASTATEGGKSSALGSLGLGALSLSALTTKKIDKNEVVLIPRKRRNTKREASERQSEEEDRRRAEEDWLYGKEWGWDDQDEGEKGVGSKVLVVRDSESRAEISLSRVESDRCPSPVLADLAQVLDTSNGQVPRTSLGSISYPSPVEETVVTPPFVISLLSNSTLSIHTTDTLTSVQTLDLPTQSNSSIVSNLGANKISTSARLLTPSSSSSPPLFFLTTSSVGAATAGAGAPIVSQTLWIVRSQSWIEQIEALGAQGLWSKAIQWFRLALPFSESASQPLSMETVKRLKLLRSWELFNEGRFGLAVDAFIRLEVSAVKVVGLYPERLAGRLVRDDAEKEEAFGGRKAEDARAMQEAKPAEGAETKMLSDAVDSSTPSPSHHHFSLAARLRESTIGSSSATPSSPNSTIRSSSVDSARLGTNSSDEAQQKAFNVSVDELVRFLTDRRQQINKALSLLPPSRRPLSSRLRPQATKEQLDDIPDRPVAQLSIEQLARLAQVVDTALFKSYLATKPVMVGPLCRIDNWCEVEEVEEALLEKKKYRELLDLYNGKSTHQKAVKLLRRIAEDEDDLDEKVEPTIRYVQKLGPDHLSTILEASEWVFATHRAKGLEIFIADLEEVEALPRHQVMQHLEGVGEEACMRYLEHVVHELDERGAEFHEKLIEVYLRRVLEGGQGGVGDEEGYKKLLAFLEASESYRADRMLGRLPASTLSSVAGTISSMTKKDEALALVRALLLGRLGRHEGALRIYVYQLAAAELAEDYCRRVVASEEDVFHILLRIYLRPTNDQKVMFAPALELVKKYALYLDPIVVFDLLPPLVSIADLKVFLEKTLRRSVQAKNDTLVLKAITKSLSEKEEREKVDLEERRVKVTEGRVCPVCGKRLGNSVLAIFLPRGEVGHYQCREAFQERRKDLL
ncbi:BZ3500_MvSof-1268-A1-R1_Chr11-3g03615 [Microbotryum saponariae]|uniref:BZ3500_MvSof-1268-A1-R1_Chr11-3g03615 protein n=1 Tax=Microbotryum saponariae TaxID=289078 RepID=A0A2X0L9V1_9BASI|nr:BZ3500_MvSof-1268-A1-R1_Chr11-3g03615 [Microbotryum saponariae]SDA03624.1 BZ3501_MvSof-1269-A2-R1_Chr11g03192 [Microbotryum saponariae]